MGILDNFIKKLSQPKVEVKMSIQSKPTSFNEEEYNVEDKRRAICPYCEVELKKVPGAKTKCSSCKQFMYVRTTPKGIRKVVTSEEAEEIEEAWAIASDAHDEYLNDKQGFADEKEALRRQFGKEPSNNDVRWRILNKELIKNAQNMNFGLYRNNRSEMAEILRKEGKLETALATNLEVCYLDLNGPNNLGGIPMDAEILSEFPTFDPERSAFLAPGMIDRVKRAVKKMDINEDRVREIFLKEANQAYSSLKLPLEPESCWSILWQSIEG